MSAPLFGARVLNIASGIVFCGFGLGLIHAGFMNPMSVQPFRVGLIGTTSVALIGLGLFLLYYEYQLRNTEAQVFQHG